MRILYDGHIFRWQKLGGISRYFFEIISRLPADWRPTLLGTEVHNGSLPTHPCLEVSNLSSIKPRRFTQPIKKAWWKYRHVDRANIFHPTFYNLTGGLEFAEIGCPVVITVHDFIKALYPHLEGDSTEALRHQREAIRHAAHLICVSQATERDLLACHPEAKGKTSVIHHGSSFPVCEEPQAGEVLERPMFLFVGRRATYKNFGMVLRAFSKACQAHPGIQLRLAGPPLDDEERWQIHFLGISNRVDSSVFPDERALQQLYRNSAALLYPSRHEGFGIPPLEAMACGTVAVTSDATSLPEVVGDGGIMLDPANEEAWTECILQIASGKIRRSELIERGRKRAATFSWEKSAQSHVEIYKALAQING
jgi:glycosyltransferase involved in cell wall biosynthesis